MPVRSPQPSALSHQTRRETALGPPVLAHLSDHGLDCRTELPVTLAGQQVSSDIVARRETEAGAWWYVVVELKRALTPEAVEQATRWVGLSNQVLVGVVEPRRISERTKLMADVCAANGIGVLFITAAGSVITKVKSAHNADADTRVVQHAFEQPASAPDPPAGSPSGPEVKRNTTTRSKWAAATEYVRQNPGCGGAEIRRSRVLGFDATPAAMAKAVIRGEWTGVRVQDRDVPATFWPAD